MPGMLSIQYSRFHSLLFQIINSIITLANIASQFLKGDFILQLLNIRFKLSYHLILLALPLLTIMLVETLHRGSFSSFLNWAFNNSLTFFLTYLLVLALFSIFILLPNRFFIAMVFLQIGALSILSFISYKKQQIRGDYFSPQDFLLVEEATEISKYLGELLSVKSIILIILTLILFIAMFWFVNKISSKTSLKIRGIASIIGVLLFFLLAINPAAFKASDDEHIGLQKGYEQFGFIGGLTYISNEYKAQNQLLNDGIPTKLNDNILAPYEGEVDPDFTPNVVLILAEALWDPLLLSNIEFEEDPIPFIRELMNTHSSGHLLTHIFGGGTINTEMEILTGLSTRFLPEGSETYNHYLTRPIDSLAHNFKEQGYHTTSVHTFKNWFYDRDKTYKELGFEKFVSMEFFSNPDYIGPYIDDRELMRQSLAELQMTDGPDFLNVATVSSHGPYDDVRYKNDLPITTKSDLTEVPNYILNLYLEVLAELDDAIKLLIDGINELDEPTMVVIYGDHLPMLGYDYAVYREAGYFEDFWEFEDYKKMYSTPLIVWDNYSDAESEDLRMTPNFLGSYILEHTKKMKSPIFKVSGNVYDKGLTVIPNTYFIPDENVDEALLSDYKLLQQDILFGNQIVYDDYPIKVVEDYFLGSEKFIIHDATLVSQNGQKKIELTGSGFVSNAKLFIDDKEVASDFTDSNHMLSRELKNMKDLKGKVTVQIKLFDDKNNVIASSNKMKITIKK